MRRWWPHDWAVDFCNLQTAINLGNEKVRMYFHFPVLECLSSSCRVVVPSSPPHTHTLAVKWRNVSSAHNFIHWNYTAICEIIWRCEGAFLWCGCFNELVLMIIFECLEGLFFFLNTQASKIVLLLFFFSFLFFSPALASNPVQNGSNCKGLGTYSTLDQLGNNNCPCMWVWLAAPFVADWLHRAHHRKCNKALSKHWIKITAYERSEMGWGMLLLESNQWRGAVMQTEEKRN